MFSLQRILGQEDKFFEMLELSAEEGRNSVRALVCLIGNPTNTASLAEFADSRRKEKEIANQISDALCSTFITAFEREDIEELSQVLYRIPKTVQKIGERILLAPHFLEGVDLSRQVTMMEGANAALLSMLKELHKGLHPERMRELNAELQRIEGEADKVMLTVLRDLFSGKYEARQAIFLRDIYELSEKLIDRHRDAGNVLIHIVLKNA